MPDYIRGADIRAAMQHLLKEDEGLSLKPYVDSRGWLTIGYGHNLGVYAAPSTWRKVKQQTNDNITLDVAEHLLDTDIGIALLDLYKVFGSEPENPLQTLDIVQVAVLGCMAFQMGYNGFTSFKRMIAAVKAGDVEATVREMLDSTWARNFTVRAREYADLYTRPDLFGGEE